LIWTAWKSLTAMNDLWRTDLVTVACVVVFVNLWKIFLKIYAWFITMTGLSVVCVCVCVCVRTRLEDVMSCY
jgi:hypothetical protein